MPHKKKQENKQIGKEIACQDDISRHIAHNEIAACIHLQMYSVPVL